MAQESAALQAQLVQMQAQAADMQAQVAESWEAEALMWRITAATVVLLMQLGFSLIEAGTVRYKNTRNIMIKNALDTCITAIAFWLFGYAFAFGEGNAFIGWAYPNGQLAFAQAEDPVSFFFQFVFVATSATIFAGAVAERAQISAYLLFNFFLAAIIYPVVAHMIWSPWGLLSVESPYTPLGAVGTLDNAGSMVVHVTGGVTSLVAAWVVGPRLGRFDINGHPVEFRGHSLVFIAAGTLAIWAGFLGFNGGSVQLFEGEHPRDFLSRILSSVMNTTISAAFAGATTFTLTYWRKEPCPEHTFNGVLGGLVAACATSSLVYSYCACAIGVVSGLVYLGAVWVITDKAGIDDPVHAAAVHLGCGCWGSIAAGLMAAPAFIQETYHMSQPPSSCGLFYGCGFAQLGVQILALLFVFAWVGITSLLLFGALNFVGKLRVSRQEEELGLDIAFHGAGGFGDDVNIAMAEEGGVDGRKLAALHMRLDAWRRLRTITKAQRQEAAASGVPPPMPSAISFVRTSTGTGEPGGGRSGAGAPPPMRVFGEGGVLAGLVGSSQAFLGAGAEGARSALAGRARDVWHRELESAALGHFSLAMYEANYVMEDTLEVHSTGDAVFLAVHDGHNGSEAAEFVRDSLWTNIKARCKAGGLTPGTANAEAIASGFADTEGQLTDVVRQAFDDTAPHLATVGACTAAVLVTQKGLWAANVGDCRAVLGQMRQEESGELEYRAVQLTREHNLADKDLREAYIMQHLDMPDAVQLKRGAYRVKGRVTVTRCFGDLYLKSHEFNREPLVSRFRIPEPFNPPLLSAQPSVCSRSLGAQDSFVIVASDGLFEFLSNEDAVRIVASNGKKDAARVLIREALQRAARRKEVDLKELLKTPSGQRRTFHDDISCIVFFFDHDALRRTSRRPRIWHQNASYRGGSSTKGGGTHGAGQGASLDLGLAPTPELHEAGSGSSHISHSLTGSGSGRAGCYGSSSRTRLLAGNEDGQDSKRK